MNDPTKIDTFYEIFNASRCKTAMLIISCLIFLAVIIAELTSGSSQFLQFLAISILGFWTGRSTKANKDTLEE